MGIGPKCSEPMVGKPVKWQPFTVLCPGPNGHSTVDASIILERKNKREEEREGMSEAPTARVPLTV